MSNRDKATGRLSRRNLLKASIVSTAAATTLPAAAFNYRPTNPGSPGNPGNPTCGTLTISQTEGPYFTPNSPEKVSLREPRYPGTNMILKGRVLSSSNCEPIAGALVDIWHADDDGEYDNQTYRFRGHQFTNNNGEFYFETIVPGLYPGRTRHIHVKVQKPGGRILTTQLYFPADARENDRDYIYDSSMLMDISQDGRTQIGEIDFIIA